MNELQPEPDSYYEQLKSLFIDTVTLKAEARSDDMHSELLMAFVDALPEGNVHVLHLLKTLETSIVFKNFTADFADAEKESAARIIREFLEKCSRMKISMQEAEKIIEMKKMCVSALKTLTFGTDRILAAVRKILITTTQSIREAEDELENLRKTELVNVIVAQEKYIQQLQKRNATIREVINAVRKGIKKTQTTIPIRELGKRLREKNIDHVQELIQNICEIYGDMAATAVVRDYAQRDGETVQMYRTIAGKMEKIFASILEKIAWSDTEEDDTEDHA